LIRTRVILGYLGRIILIIGISMLSSVLCSLYYRESIIIPFSLAAGVTIVTGLLLVFSAEKQAIHYKEGFVIVSLGWLLASLFGSLPYIFTGCLPSFADAFFETVSGFTTTGASVITNVEATPKGLLFWRSLTQWLGGMGIIGLFVAIISGMGAQANHLFKAEVPGPVASKISPRVRETAKKLWITYIILSVCCAVLLYLFGMDIFDSLCHTFATMATGGFSTRNASIGYYDSPLIQWTLTIFMFIAGVNFTLHYLGFKQRNLQVYLKNREFLFYTAIVVVASLLVSLSLSLGGSELSTEGKVRAAFFQVVTIVTTTGYSSVDFELWPNMALGIIFLMMFVGGCAGSTGGNIKPGRYLILLHRSIIEIKRIIHPKAVISLRFNDRIISDSLLINVLQFFFLYIMFLALGTIGLSCLDIDLITSLTAAASCLGNIGPGLGQVGPMDNYSFIADGGKYLLSLLMLVGRLEIYPLLLLFLPDFWRE